MRLAEVYADHDAVGANDAYEKALELEPTNAQAKSGLDAVKRAIAAEGSAGGNDPLGGLGGVFKDPQLFQKLAANPKTSHLIGDASFMQVLQQIQQNPSTIMQHIGDQRILSVMSVLMGLPDMGGAGPGGPGEEAPRSTEVEEELPSSSRPEPAAPKQDDKMEVDDPPEEAPEDEDAIAAKKAKEEADKEKALGTEAYKKRQFDDAIAHYEKAWELHKDITYLTNLGAAKFEKGDYPGAIEACEKAVEYGREVFADWKIIAKAFGRIGSAYEKQGDLANAVEYYNRSLTEHRTPDILAKRNAAEKARVTQERTAYVNPDEAEKARELGNQKFKDADWPGAVGAYSEMVKRAPEDPRGYSNRAACFIKLLAFPSAVTDCDEAIRRDPKFIRAYLRKAQAFFAMKEYNKCLDVCTEASAHDEGGKNAREIQQQQEKAVQAMYSAREGETEEETMARIQKDPEVSTFADHRFDDTGVLTIPADHEPSPGPSHAEHPPAGEERPGRASGAHEEPAGQSRGAEADGRRRHSPGPVSVGYGVHALRRRLPLLYLEARGFLFFPI